MKFKDYLKETSSKERLDESIIGEIARRAHNLIRSIGNNVLPGLTGILGTAVASLIVSAMSNNIALALGGLLSTALASIAVVVLKVNEKELLSYFSHIFKSETVKEFPQEKLNILKQKTQELINNPEFAKYKKQLLSYEAKLKSAVEYRDVSKVFDILQNWIAYLENEKFN